MKKKPRIKEHYVFIVSGDRVSASAKFAGNWVTGHARCHPDDSFNEDFGKALAAARCNRKIASRRYARAVKKYAEAVENYHDAHKRLYAMSEYLTTSYELFKDSKERERSVLNWSIAGECAHDCS